MLVLNLRYLILDFCGMDMHNDRTSLYLDGLFGLVFNINRFCYNALYRKTCETE